MVNTGALLVGIFLGLLAQIATFFQMQGFIKYDWFKNHYWLTVLMGIPISMLFMLYVKNMILAFDGQMWPSRLIGFSLGAIVFSGLSWFVFNEPLTTKTIICLGLAIAILLVQLLMK